jgi:hypothetical protein
MFCAEEGTVSGMLGRVKYGKLWYRYKYRYRHILNMYIYFLHIYTYVGI